MISENTAGNMIREINDALEKNANNALRSEGLTLSQIGLLLDLEAAPDGILTITSLTKKLHVAQPTVTGIVGRLEKKKLVKILGDPADKRVRNVLITGEGRKVCAYGEAQMKKTEARLLSPLDASERESFLAMLKKVHDGLLR